MSFITTNNTILDSEVLSQLSSKVHDVFEKNADFLNYWSSFGKKHSSSKDPLFQTHPSSSKGNEKNSSLSFLDSLFSTILRDKRDAIFVKYTLLLSLSIPSSFYLVFVSFTWIHYMAHALFVGKFATSFVLMLHCTCHRRLYKPPYQLLNGVIPYFLGPIFGHTWDSFYFHHIKHHHVEDNGPEDLSSTLRYQRDDFFHFLLYFMKFLLLDTFLLTYHFYRKNRLYYAFRFALGESLSYAFYTWTLKHSVYPVGAFLVFLLPFFLMRFGMMSGNWAQHAFVDRSRPDCDFVQSLTCINNTYNQIAFNDGYHTSHHLNPRRHWMDHPEHLVTHLEAYAHHGTLVFNELDFHQVWFLLMIRNYKALAKAFVPLGPNYPTNESEIIVFLKERTKQMSEQEVKTYYERKKRDKLQ
ncbi:hypothetical protein HMI54_010718 [Coelomomyces lativittatus]|nr:hypothetical protein HMI56_001339 [Coelomomyces lativittatus]KAJ1508806.1 hypothetical protein HMI55_000220 [Coelomomyces lativittatus]KAJ1516136.1 hypothetical protein HMI54_010718 [Coelomomyces lativittatus]